MFKQKLSYNFLNETIHFRNYCNFENFLGDAQLFKDEASYSCNDGYFLEGVKSLTCLANGEYGDLSTSKFITIVLFSCFY